MKNMIGVVVKNSSQNSVKVRIERSYHHPKYEKLIKSFKNMLVHDEIGVVVGDTVKITLCAPISKMKKYKVEAKI